MQKINKQFLSLIKMLLSIARKIIFQKKKFNSLNKNYKKLYYPKKNYKKYMKYKFKKIM